MKMTAIFGAVITVAVSAILIASVLPDQLNKVGNTTLTDSTMNGIWILTKIGLALAPGLIVFKIVESY